MLFMTLYTCIEKALIIKKIVATIYESIKICVKAEEREDESNYSKGLFRYL